MKKKLDSLERQIEDNADQFRPVSDEKLREIEQHIAKAQKSRNVNIRISEHLLRSLKERALAEGIPYQTLISSVLHKYVTERLIDEDAMRRVIKCLKPPSL